jgi:hypothetical protein
VEHDSNRSKTYDVTDAELEQLSRLGLESTVFFSVCASAVAIAAGVWLSLDSGTGLPRDKTFVDRFLVYGGLPFFATFGTISGILGFLMLRRHRAAVRDIKSRLPVPKTYVVRKDGMDVDLTSPPQE